LRRKDSSAIRLAGLAQITLVLSAFDAPAASYIPLLDVESSVKKPSADGEITDTDWIFVQPFG
jgi:hypothetical protein